MEITMDEKALEIPQEKNWQPKILIVGGVLGALVGLAGAFLLVKNAEKTGEDIEITFPEWVRLGLLVLGLLRSIATLHQD
jgi:hypothetical protein